jgi:hypothetical protein
MTITCLAMLGDDLDFSQSSVHAINSNSKLEQMLTQVMN